MDLVIDIGNTNISLGVFDQGSQKEIKKVFRLITPDATTTDELAFNIINMLEQDGIMREEITRSIFSSVVPSLNHNVTKLMNNYFDQEIDMVTHADFSDFKINYRDKEDLGIDRLVNIKSAAMSIGLPVIVIDFGTATTVDVVNGHKEYLGGLIIPGVVISLNSLIENTSKLPKIELEHPRGLLGNSTKENMQNGLYYSNSLGVGSILKKIIDEVFPTQKDQVKVVVTGGLANFISRNWEIDSILMESLTLKGLKIILDEK